MLERSTLPMSLPVVVCNQVIQTEQSPVVLFKNIYFDTQNVGHLGKKVAILKFCLAKDISLK